MSAVGVFYVLDLICSLRLFAILMGFNGEPVTKVLFGTLQHSGSWF